MKKKVIYLIVTQGAYGDLYGNCYESENDAQAEVERLREESFGCDAEYVETDLFQSNEREQP